MSLAGWSIPDFTSPFEDGARALLSRAVDLVEPPPSRAELPSILKPEAAELLDALAVRCARGRGACDLLIGAELARMKRHGGENRLGLSVVEDFARERLGLSESFTRRLLRLDEALGTRPLLRAAVWSGVVTRRKAEIVLRRAQGDEEERWVELARTSTARALEVLAKDPGATEERDEDAPLRRIFAQLDADTGPVLRDGLEVAGVIAGPGSSTVQRLEAMAMEYLAAHGELAPDRGAPPDRLDEVTGLQRPAPRIVGDAHLPRVDVREILERESQRWSYLADPPPVSAGDAPVEGEEPFDPYACQDRLRELVAERNAWDHDLGRACLTLLACGSWRTAQFASFEHYCHERLGMGASTVKQRVALERKLHELPALREAMREGRLSYEQARLIARVATPTDVERRIAEAVGKTCIALRRSLEPAFHAPVPVQPAPVPVQTAPVPVQPAPVPVEPVPASPSAVASAPAACPACCAGQMWNRSFSVVVPLEVATVIGDAMIAARAQAKQWLSTAQALAVVAAHFLETYREEAKQKLARATKAKKRDRFMCQIPGCSRAADDDHHILYRSRGGSDDPSNRLAVCAIHHHRCIHRGSVLVLGTAPDALTFVLGEREVAAFKDGAGRAAA